MDDRRFDGLTRAMARNARRRSLLRAVAGGAGGALLAVVRRGSPASAHHGRLGPGDACYHNRQCVAADAPLVCADNGVTYDGPLNCCTHVGSRCGFDEACCSSASCHNGFCAERSVSRRAGEPCQHASQCVTAGTTLYCTYVANTDDYRCCAVTGGRCVHNRGCCGTLTCNGGRCGRSAA